MDSQVEEPPRAKIYSLRLACEKNIQAQQQSIDALTASFRKSLSSIRSSAPETINYQSINAPTYIYSFLHLGSAWANAIAFFF